MSGPDTRDPTAAPDTPETRRAAYEAAMETGDVARALAIARAPVPPDWPEDARRRWGPRRTEASDSDGVLKEIGKWVLIVVLGWIAPWWLLGQIARWARAIFE